MDKYAKKRDKLIDEIIRLKKEYFDCMEDEVLVRSANEVLKYGQTQEPRPEIPQRYFVDLAANIGIDQKIDSLVGLIEKTYDITNQEREFLNSFYK
jgi:hypothetical protein